MRSVANITRRQWRHRGLPFPRGSAITYAVKLSVDGVAWMRGLQSRTQFLPLTE